MSAVMHVDKFSAVCAEIDWHLYNFATSDSNQQAIFAIGMLIENGINTEGRIIGAMKSLRYDARHVAVVLKRSTGRGSTRYEWSCDDQGCYRNHVR